MTTWFTADLHFGHINIIEYTNRPFASVDEMNAGLIAAWNDTVAPTDTIWVLGDFAMGQIRDMLEVVPDLNGHKLLLSGNHDRTWHGHGPNALKWQKKYIDAGFAEIHSGTIDLNIDGTDVLACHFPYVGDSHDAERFVQHRPTDHGQWLLHGHVHTTWAQHGHMINVGTDVANYRPVSEHRIAELIAAGPTDRALIHDSSES